MDQNGLIIIFDGDFLQLSSWIDPNLSAPKGETTAGRQAPPLRRQHHQVDRGEDHQQQQVEALENHRRIIVIHNSDY